MSRGNGKKANDAIRSGRLSAFVSKQDAGSLNGDGLTPPDWGEVNSYYLTGAVKAVVSEGGAIMYGSSRDKKSYSVRVYDGDAGQSYYFPATNGGVEELETFLLALSELASAGE